MIHRFAWLAVTMMLAPVMASAQENVCAARKLKSAGATSGAVSPAEVCRVLSVLADDSLEGRGTATRGGARAAAFIAKEFREAGLEPAGDSGYFQRVPLVFVTRNGRAGAVGVPSFAVRDTFPADRRGLAVNVLGILRGSDPVLKDSVVLVDAHYDHLGLRPGGPVDVDSVAAWNAAVAPIQAERARWLKAAGVDARAAARGAAGLSDEQRATLTDFANRIAAVRVNIDSLRRVRPVPRRDSVYNGADDDAAGTTAVIEIARKLASGPRPKRTIVFAATTGEELGLIGTNWYIAHPAMPLASMEANLEIEMIGRPDSLAGGPGRAWLTGFERSTMGSMFAAAGLAVVPDKRPEQGFFQRSDNIAFARAGIPAHTLSTFNLHTDYHQLTDEIAGVDFDHMAGVINTAVKAVGMLANGPAPTWNPAGKP